MTNATGVCRFCGQTSIKEVPTEWSKDEIDELTAETCECTEAGIYSDKKEQKERANDRIELLFGEKSGAAIREETKDFLHAAIDPICSHYIQSVTVDAGNGTKGKISVTSKGFVKVSRTDTQKSEYEA